MLDKSQVRLVKYTNALCKERYEIEIYTKTLFGKFKWVTYKDFEGLIATFFNIEEAKKYISYLIHGTKREII